MAYYELTDELRAKLKAPIGELLIGNSSQNMNKLKEIIRKDKPSMVICVGDAVSRSTAKAKISVNVRIIDNKEMRERIKPFNFKAKRFFLIKNDPGTINLTSLEAVEEAIKHKDSLVLVDGEEDLLALVAIALAPNGSIIIYGQPNLGIVVVKVNEVKKNEAKSIIKSMKLVKTS
ncbi:MAG: DUF359 domain-containing protein [Candidatus Bathyarchaeia archaeon]